MWLATVSKNKELAKKKAAMVHTYKLKNMDQFWYNIFQVQAKKKKKTLLDRSVLVGCT